MSKIIAAYGGGFKPPTKGHLEVVKKALESLPEIDEFIIYVGSKERNGVSQAEAILIWDIFKKYLPMKVKIEPAKSPIGDIVRLGKNNPEDEVYFIIGGRAGRDDDLKDIENRTKNIESAYPNMKVKVQFTQDKGMSGTNARKAAKVSSDKLAPFLPDELDDSEKEEIFNILRPVIKEEITKPQLDSIEKYADGLFNKLGIDIEFTRHFLDRVNDKRNIKPISVPELVGMFKRLHRKHGKPLSKIDDDFNAVVKDFNSNINIPFAINVTDDDIEMYAKTVMRKKDFKTSTPVIALNENASYTKDINLIEKLAQLTQHMLDKGMNIEPLPNLEFVDGDSENAREFLGKTAYYDPNTQTIVLYTEGRHPKDIARSYTHEMIHHIQNLEGRLGDIQTTNTQEDDNLNDIEAEANLKGTMTFRNWTDSLNEDGQETSDANMDDYKKQNNPSGKVKDPFGLNAYAYELALGLEEEIINEGVYDSLVTKLTNLTIKKWIADYKADPKLKQSFIDIDIDEEDSKGRPIEFNYVGRLIFDKKVDGYEVDGTSNSGEEEDKFPFIATLFTINPEVLPQAWSKLSADVSDVVRHEIEHLTQSGDNLRTGKYKDDDLQIRDMINKLKVLPYKNYYLLDKEVDAMLQGLYLKAKKTKKPFADVINNYLDIAPGIETAEDKEMILDLWRSRRKALSLPVFENEEKVMNYKIHLDMDGVITDFNSQFKELTGMMPNEFEAKYGVTGFWEAIDKAGVGFWRGMKWMPDGEELYNKVSQFDHMLLSSPSRGESSKIGKRLWRRDKTPNTKLTLAYSANKKNYAAPNHILIDDRADNINQWEAAGGIGILHTSTASTLAKLKELGL